MTTNAYEARPWTKLLPRQRTWSSVNSMLEVFRDAVAERPDNVAIRYFDKSITYRELDRLSNAFALWLSQRGARKGDRVCLAVQNMPQFTISALGIWKVGAIPTPTNPMYREGELRKVFADCTPIAVICQPENASVVRNALSAAGVSADIVTTSPLEFQARNDTRVLPAKTPGEGDSDFAKILAAASDNGFNAVSAVITDVALLMYTSGTTGLPKGVMLTHGNLISNAQTSVDWFDLSESSRILGIAPLFHITGFELHLCLPVLLRASVILNFRFHPQVVLEAIVEHRPTFTIGAITAFLALMNAEEATAEHFSSFKRIYSGGAPIPPPIVEQFEAKFGISIRGSYGMTEMTAPSHYSPPDIKTPVDPESGAFAMGIPLFNTDAVIVDEAGQPAPVGQAGELLVRGPQVMAGYWNKPKETAETLRDGWMHTGDVCFMDEHGWFYIVDRKKDVIIASGFKVWPREVEDVLYSHPAVREAAVIGIADPYRGESVKACISLHAQASVSSDELKQFCRERLAAYKVPSVFDVLPDLPKTVSGKIMRSELRSKG